VEQSYRRAWEDREAAGSRRWAALYGLGNSLLHQHPGQGVKVLFDAVACYEQVLAAADAEPQLREDARHNLELAKLLWAQERGQNDDKKPPNDGGSDDPQKNPPNTRPDQGGNPTTGTPDQRGQKVPVDVKGGQNPIPVEQSPAPGSGNLPPVPETNDQPLAAEDALAHLRQAVAEILREKQQYQMKSAKPPARGVKDW